MLRDVFGLTRTGFLELHTENQRLRASGVPQLQIAADEIFNE